MPYKSRKQEQYFNANKAELESKGVNVDEWNQASKGLTLPERADNAIKKKTNKAKKYKQY